MTHLSAADHVVLAAQTFGRDGAMFQNLLEFVAQLSVVLWAVVIITVLIRFVGVRIYRPRRTHPTLVATPALVAPPAVTEAEVLDAVPTTTGEVDVIQPGDEIFFGDLLSGAAAGAAEAALAPAEPADGNPINSGWVRLGWFSDQLGSTDDANVPLHTEDLRIGELLEGAPAGSSSTGSQIENVAESSAAHAPVQVPRRAPRTRSEAPVAALAANSTEA